MEALPIRMYDNFRNKLKLADPDAKEMVESINEVIDRKIVNQNDTTMSMNRKDMEALKSFIEVKFSEADKKNASKVELADVKGSLLAEIANTKAEIIKWMFLFWVGQVAVTFGFILLFLKK